MRSTLMMHREKALKRYKNERLTNRELQDYELVYYKR